MKQSLSITSLYKRGGSIDPISGAAAAEDNAASATILDKANNSSALSLGPAGVSNPAGPSLSLAVSSPMSGSEDATLPISPWRKVSAGATLYKLRVEKSKLVNAILKSVSCFRFFAPE